MNDDAFDVGGLCDGRVGGRVGFGLPVMVRRPQGSAVGRCTQAERREQRGRRLRQMLCAWG